MLFVLLHCNIAIAFPTFKAIIRYITGHLGTLLVMSHLVGKAFNVA